MKPDKSIIVVGSHTPGIFMRVEKIPLAGETVLGWDFQEPIDGGKGSNQAIAASLLTSNVYFVGCVGQDRLGDEAVKWMQQVGVDTRYLRRSINYGTAAGFILLDANGIPAMVSSMGANGDLNEKDIECAISEIPDAGVILTQFEIPNEIALYAVRSGKQRGLTTIVNPAPWVDVPLKEFCGLDILVPNETEAMAMLGINQEHNHPNPFEVAAELRRLCQVKSVIVTMGGDGVIIADEVGCIKITPPKVKVLDTSGAGDAFCGALAYQISCGCEVRTSAEWACQVATLSVTRPGTIPSYPTLNEVEKFINFHLQ